tara:strand:- start:1451 stop:1645 length:195 start_codon:yes stop_codon:yes gene_type:complete
MSLEKVKELLSSGDYPTDEEFASFVSRVDSGELSIETIKDNDNFQSEETGISDKQYDMVSKFFD